MTMEDEEERKLIPEELRPKASLFSNRRKFSILLCIALYQFTCSCINSMLAPFFPGVAAKKGASVAVVGVIFSSFSLVVCIFSPIMGYLIPKLGPNFVLLSGQFIEGGAEILFGFVGMMPDGSVFIALSFIVRCVSAVGASATSVTSLMLLTENFKDNISSAMGFTEVMGGFGYMLGPVLGGLLYSVGGFRLPFVIFGSIIVVGLLPAYFILPPESKAVRNRKWNKKALLEVLRIPAVVISCFTATLMNISIGFIEPGLRAHLNQFSLNSVKIGVMFFIGPCMYAICAIPVGFIAEKWDKKLIMIIGSLLTGIGLLLLGPAPIFSSILPRALWLNVVALIIMGIGIVQLYLPVLSDINTDARIYDMEDSVSTQSALSAVFTAFTNAGYIFGPAVGGVLIEAVNFEWACTIIAGLVLFWVPMIVISKLMVVRRLRKPKEEAEHRLSLSTREVDEATLTSGRMA